MRKNPPSKWSFKSVFEELLASLVFYLLYPIVYLFIATSVQKELNEDHSRVCNDSTEVEKVPSHMSMQPVLHKCSNWPCVTCRRESSKAHNPKNQAGQSYAVCTHVG